jgi:hypothetical protein
LICLGVGISSPQGDWPPGSCPMIQYKNIVPIVSTLFTKKDGPPEVHHINAVLILLNYIPIACVSPRLCDGASSRGEARVPQAYLHEVSLPMIFRMIQNRKIHLSILF